MRSSGLAVDDEPAADDRPLAGVQAQALHRDVDLRVPRGVGLDVAQIAGVMRGRIGCAVRVRFGREVPARAGAVGRRAVAEFVHVEAVLPAGCEARQLAGHVHGVALAVEAHRAGHLLPLGRCDHCDGIGDRGPGG